jgi:hypothetical protein
LDVTVVTYDWTTVTSSGLLAANIARMTFTPAAGMGISTQR